MMSEEELRKEATSTIEWESTPMIDRPLFVHAYITSAKPREKCIEEQKVKIAELELKIKYLTEHLEPQTASALFEQVEEEVRQEQRLKELEEQAKNRKVFLLQRVDSYDNSIDKQFYTTDEEVAKKWNDYYKRNYFYGQAIELEEFTDKDRIIEELESD